MDTQRENAKALKSAIRFALLNEHSANETPAQMFVAWQKQSGLLVRDAETCEWILDIFAKYKENENTSLQCCLDEGIITKREYDELAK